jgi:hypothetical protein
MIKVSRQVLASKERQREGGSGNVCVYLVLRIQGSASITDCACWVPFQYSLTVKSAEGLWKREHLFVSKSLFDELDKAHGLTR